MSTDDKTPPTAPDENLSADPAAAEDAAKRAAQAAGLPLSDWLRETIEEASAEVAERSAAAAAQEAGLSLPDWLNAAVKEASAADAASIAEQAASDAGTSVASWIGDLVKEASLEEGEPKPTSSSSPTPVFEARQATGPALKPPSPEQAKPIPIRPGLNPSVTMTIKPAAPTPIKSLTPPIKPASPAIKATPAEPAKPPLRAIDAASDALPPPRFVPIDDMSPSQFQMRTFVDGAEIAALAESIRTHGVLQPVIVRARRQSGGATYEIIAGERRWRAAREVGLAEVPVMAIEVTDKAAMEIALVENLQRHDLTPLEEAEGYRRLVEDMGETQAGLARAVGKSRSHVSNILRLLRLPESVKALLAAGKLTAGHARALLGAAEPAALAQRAVAENLSVREIEALAHEVARGENGRTVAPPRRARRKSTRRDPEILSIEEELSGLLGVPAKIATRGERTTLTFRFKGLDGLRQLVKRFR